MSAMGWLAFVITPAFVMALGYGVTWLHGWDMDRRDRARNRG